MLDHSKEDMQMMYMHGLLPLLASSVVFGELYIEITASADNAGSLFTHRFILHLFDGSTHIPVSGR